VIWVASALLAILVVMISALILEDIVYKRDVARYWRERRDEEAEERRRTAWANINTY